jgi:hypothetical protein
MRVRKLLNALVDRIGCSHAEDEDRGYKRPEKPFLTW